MNSPQRGEFEFLDGHQLPARIQRAVVLPPMLGLPAERFKKLSAAMFFSIQDDAQGELEMVPYLGLFKIGAETPLAFFFSQSVTIVAAMIHSSVDAVAFKVLIYMGTPLAFQILKRRT